MQEIGIGLSIGLALKGLASVQACTSSFNKLRAAVKASSGEIKGLQRRLAKIRLNGIKIENLERSMSDFKSKIVEKAALAASVAAPVKLAMDFESAMADVKKVVDFANNAEFEGFGKEILNLSRTIPLSAEELATITANGGQLGIAKENLLEFTQIVAKMGVAFDMSADDAGESIASMMNVYGLGMKEVEKLGDTINHLSDNSAAKAKNIVEAMKRIGGSAKVFGLSADQAGALASSFIALGKTPEVAATGINALLNKLQTAPEQGAKFQDALNAIGMDAGYVKQMIQQNPQKALETFLTALEKVPKKSQMSVLTGLFGAEYSDDIALLVSNLGEYRKALALANDEKKNGSLDREFKNRSETTANALRLLKNAVSEVGINIGSLFLPALASLFRAMAAFSAKISNFISAHKTLAAVVGSVVAGFAVFNVVLPAVAFLAAGLWANMLRLNTAWQFFAIAVGLGNNKLKTATNLTKAQTVAMSIHEGVVKALSVSFNFLKTSLFTAAGAMKVLKIALISTGIGAIVVALGTAAALVIDNWDAVKGFFESFWDAIKPIWEGFAAFFKGFWEVLVVMAKPFITIFGGLFKVLFGVITAIFSPLIDFFASIAKGISGAFDWVIDLWRRSFGKVFDWLAEKFSWVKDVTNSIKGFFGSGENADNPNPKDEKNGAKWYNPLSWWGDEPATPAPEPAKATPASSNLNYAPAPVAVAQTASGRAITVNFSGDFHLFSQDGKFDLNEFKAQIVRGVKDALARDAQNHANTDVRG